MTERVELLDWDTEFFGFRIGRVELDGLGPDALHAIEHEAREREITCLYGSLDPSQRELAYGVQVVGYRFVESAILLSLPATADLRPPPTSSVVRLGGPEDLDQLESAVSLMAPWSRYAVDPRFGPEAAERMHRAWVAHAADPAISERQLFVAEDDAGINAFITYKQHPRPVIDTIGTTQPGAGAPWALVMHARGLIGGAELLGGPIAARNIVALRFVENVGYRADSLRYTYHRWVGEQHQ